MRIYGIDANVLTRDRVSGTERYVASLLKAMMKQPLLDGEQVVLYTSKPAFSETVLPKGWKEHVLKWPLKKAWTHGRLSLELTLRTPNVFFSPAHEIPVRTGRAKIVSTVHDVAFHKFPNIYPDKERKRQEWSVTRSLKLSDRILTVSETTKNDLVELYKANPDKVTATPLAIYSERFDITSDEVWRVREKYHLPEEPFVLYVGRLEKKKNLSMLIKACVKANQHLILAGSFGFGADEIKEEVKATHGLVQTLGYVPDQDLAGLMRNAHAYVFPSRYEGFGIPALEAFAAEVPLIASDIPALREVAGDAAIFAHPTSVNQWGESLGRMKNEELRKELIEKGKEQLKKFSWNRTAEKTWDVLRSV